MNSHKVIESTEFLRDVYVCKYYQLKLMDTGRVQNEERVLNPQISVGRDQTEKTTQLET